MAVAAGLLLGLAFPPFPLLVPACLCLVPLALFTSRVADEGDALARCARVGAWFAVVGFGLNLYWIVVALLLFTKLAILAWIGTIVGFALIEAGMMVVLCATRRVTRWPFAILLPPVWIASEMFLLHMGDLAFPWLPLGLALAEHPHLAQLADLSGVHALSAVVALVNGLIADAVLLAARPIAQPSRHRGRAARPLAVAVLVVGVVYAYGAWRLATTMTRPLAPIMAVQPNVPEDEKLQAALRGQFMSVLLDRTRAGWNPATPTALIVWPEAALPDLMANHVEWLDSLRTLARLTRTPLVLGVLDVRFFGPDYEIYNAAMLADSAGVIGAQPAYHKSYLVPIVERVPFVNPKWFAGLKYFGGFGRGGAPVPYRLPFGRAGVVICYESIFPDLTRTYRREGTDVLLNITNDAWFGETTAPYQHAAHLRLRAIETRVGIVQVANTGISEYVDPLGRVHGATALSTPATRVYATETTDIVTPYIRWGDSVGRLAVVITLALGLAAIRDAVRQGWRPGSRRRGATRVG
jgi:apolipoprotein N-acyltransferase